MEIVLCISYFGGLLNQSADKTTYPKLDNHSIPNTTWSNNPMPIDPRFLNFVSALTCTVADIVKKSCTALSGNYQPIKHVKALSFFITTPWDLASPVKQRLSATNDDYAKATLISWNDQVLHERVPIGCLVWKSSSTTPCSGQLPRIKKDIHTIAEVLGG